MDSQIPRIEIKSTERRNDGKSDYVVYVIEVNEGDRTKTVLRRFSQFLDLHSKIKKKFVERDLPIFPAKTLWNSNSKEFIEGRKNNLEKYLQRLFEMEDIRSSPEFIDFLRTTTDVTGNTQWKGIRILVIGATSEIGQEIACQFAGKGPVKVAIAGWRVSVLDEVMKRCELLETGADVVPLIADFTQPDGCKKIIDGVLEAFQGVDIVVIAVGEGDRDEHSEEDQDENEVISLQDANDSESLLSSPFGNIGDFSWEKFQQRSQEITRANYLSAIECTYWALPLLRESEGHLIVVSSIAGKMGLPSLSLYSGAMHALHGFYDSLRYEVPECPITIACPILHKKDVRNTSQLTIDDPQATAAKIIDGAIHRAREVSFSGSSFLPLLQGFLPPNLIDTQYLKST